MRDFIYIAPWIGWFLWFIAWEAIGFYKNNDRWPTLSQIVKSWEAPRQQIVYKHVSVGTGTTFMGATPRNLRPRGITTWTWQRWLTAAGLPVLALTLELHWVWEIF